MLWKTVQRDEERKCPKVLQHGYNGSVVDGLRKQSDEEHGAKAKYCRGDGKKVGLERSKSITSQSE